MSDNQNLWPDFGVVEELTEQAAETISGGAESFSIYNDTNRNILFILDETPFGLRPGEGGNYIAYDGGIIKFDADGRTDYNQQKYNNLSDGSAYVFKPDNSTANPYDLNLYKYA
jgi:hypothetical protein